MIVAAARSREGGNLLPSRHKQIRALIHYAVILVMTRWKRPTLAIAAAASMCTGCSNPFAGLFYENVPDITATLNIEQTNSDLLISKTKLFADQNNTTFHLDITSALGGYDLVQIEIRTPSTLVQITNPAESHIYSVSFYSRKNSNTAKEDSKALAEKYVHTITSKDSIALEKLDERIR